MQAYFCSTYISHITRSTCTTEVCFVFWSGEDMHFIIILTVQISFIIEWTNKSICKQKIYEGPNQIA